ncbi:unnamed protein product [Lathyrus sativus]|nr:unnamed protein product [Lathyrus sativus]
MKKKYHQEKQKTRQNGNHIKTAEEKTKNRLAIQAFLVNLPSIGIDFQVCKGIGGGFMQHGGSRIWFKQC